MEHDIHSKKRLQAYSPIMIADGGEATLVLFLEWIQAGSPKNGIGSTVTSYETLKQIHSSLTSLYENQVVTFGGTLEGSIKAEWPTLGVCPAYKSLFDTMIASYKTKGERDLVKCPQEGTGDSTFTSEELTDLVWNILKSRSKASVRDLSMLLWMLATVSRSDDARLVYLPDLMKPVKLNYFGKLWPVGCTHIIFIVEFVIV